ncbi:Vesicular integral-membrane protein VIP36 [Cichlidogyrus casuarinus]|uniref:Vesicular integral-membrane protein VIP36 n=1 Tax=Cichlidogyrus casuarinus TaxID=1844966 RepID=A0ABD2QKG3_9PLAT
MPLFNSCLFSSFKASTWNTRGHAIVTDRMIRLTTDGKSQRGAVFSTKPTYLPHWEVHMEFKVYSSTNTRLGGDGFAFWLIKQHEQGTAFGSKETFKGLAIVFDTYKNNQDDNQSVPFVGAIVNNGTLRYNHDLDGIDIMNAKCSILFRNKAAKFIIRYQDETLFVTYDISETDKYSECFTLHNLILPTSYYFGLSAATGDLHGKRLLCLDLFGYRRS